jgi:hypothetical protein
MAALTSDTLLSRNPDMLVALVPEGYVMLSLEADRYLEFNPTAAAVWDLLETPRTVQALCDDVRARFEVEAARCENEVRALLDHLIGLHVIRIHD